MASSRLAGVGLVFSLSLGLFALSQRPENEQGARAVRKEIRTDAYGDVLPEGAVARLGTVRWRHKALKFAFSSDGNYFVACWTTPRLYDARSGRFLRSIDTRADHVHFSPDSKELITFYLTEKPQRARFWDVTTGKERRSLPVKGNPASWSGQFLATVTYDDRAGKGISIWDLGSGKELARLTLPVQDFFSTAVAPNGKTVAVRYPTRLYLLEAVTGKELCSLPLRIGGSTVFAPDSKTLIFTDDGNVSFLDVATGRTVRQLEIPQRRNGILALSPDGRYLAALAGPLYVWDLSSGKLLHAIEDTGMHGSSLLAFAGDGKTIAAQAHLSHLIRVWDVASGKETTLTDPAEPVHRVAFSADSKSLISLYTARMTGPGTIRQDFVSWNLATAKPMQHLLNFDRKHVSHFIAAENRISPNRFSTAWGVGYPTCSPDGKTIPVVFVGKEKPERRWRPKEGERGRDISIHWTMVGLWDVRAEKMVRSFRVDVDWSSEAARTGDDSLRHLVLSPDGKLLAGWAGYNSIFVWDLASGLEVRRWSFPGFPGPQCNAIAFSQDGRTLISSHFQWRTKKNTFHFHELATGDERAKVDCAIDIPHLRCGPVFDGHRLAALAVEETVYLIDPATGRKLGQFKGHLEDITCLAFSADRRFLATGSFDTTIMIWDVSAIFKR